MLHDYIFPVVNYDSIKNQYNADGFKHLVYFVTGFLFNVSIKDAMIYLNSLQFTFMAISRTPSRRYPWKLQKFMFGFSTAAACIWCSGTISSSSTKSCSKILLAVLKISLQWKSLCLGDEGASPKL